MKKMVNTRDITKLRLLLVVIATGCLLQACEMLLTEPPEPGTTFEETLADLTKEELAAFARGDEAFGHAFSVKEGLGPIFNQPSCETCHPRDGKANPRANLIRFGRTSGGSTDPLFDLGGPQFQDHSIPGVQPEVLPPEANAISPRSGPVVFGIGLIEAIPDSAILANADSNDANADGISGRPNWVSAPEYIGKGPGPHLGRFGRKAGVAFLLQQVVTAYQQDIGITTDFVPEEAGHPQAGTSVRDDAADPELPAAVVNDVVAYLRTLAPPKRGTITPEVQQGEQLFNQVGCASCHVPKMRTGVSPVKALNNVDVELYSDFLLHDMGTELEDNFYEGSSTGREWRTTPLWGLRLIGEFTGGTPYYLHDGRTSDLVVVIQFHGGEASQARTNFQQLSQSERNALIKFLESL
ncbi:MAG: thiol oxidoreductase [Ignavibacteriales bacterium]|nr:thiol oxidoreductase [Ignavibacteriales bacterium]